MKSSTVLTGVLAVMFLAMAVAPAAANDNQDTGNDPCPAEFCDLNFPVNCGRECIGQTRIHTPMSHVSGRCTGARVPYQVLHRAC
jgi:hypothetical protein